MPVPLVPAPGPDPRARFGRRGFLALGGGAALFAAGCDSNNDDDDDGGDAAVTIDLSTDVGILNYAYALEQAESAFYRRIVASTYFQNANADERSIWTDLNGHELVHVEFYRRALGADRIPDLVPDFEAVNFADRTSVLTTAKTFADLGTAAYNGGGRLFENPDFLALAGKLVSVEARHVSIIRELLRPNTDFFANVSDIPDFGANDGQGLDGALRPRDVVRVVNPFLVTKVAVRNDT